LRDKSVGGVNDRFGAARSSQHGSQRQFCKCKLLPAQFARDDTSLAVKRENGKRRPHDSDRRAPNEFDDDFGCAHPLPSKQRHEMVCRISQHPVELRVRQAIDGLIPCNEIPLA